MVGVVGCVVRGLEGERGGGGVGGVITRGLLRGRVERTEEAPLKDRDLE